MKTMKEKDPKEIFSYDDEAVNQVHNQITDAYSSGVVGEQYSQNAYQPTEEEQNKQEGQ
ncbi:hypothetical protein JOC95_002439 [Bacillus tianshenii]|uniref:Uncharacterized protein n=1 Tax=Sutcliffiella tianshenii TaxID=1463404 RepID=A0ABS2P135_9BACI|nr:hypothetical protein [Bacillus tianshenii]MBM7620586.1 hypothetical protein [Bacillus tianshenii]MCA1319866.1 hypothetical protein [Bacillus tianshenii]